MYYFVQRSIKLLIIKTIIIIIIIIIKGGMLSPRFNCVTPGEQELPLSRSAIKVV